jgi:hypothetical protein
MMDTHYAHLPCGWYIQVEVGYPYIQYHSLIYCYTIENPTTPTKDEIRQAIKIWYNSFLDLELNDYLNQVFSKAPKAM